ncbi:MAG: HAD family hydrolase [Dehalococcoidales bacterium]|nr:HAD family hydrolase [Dehalococcoidales bacterium]
MKHSAVIFDLDGTLLDTLKDLADSVNSALGYLGLPEHDLEAYRYFVGDGREAMASRALPEDRRDTATLNRIIPRINEEYSRRWAENTRPYPGIPELLDELTGSNVRMAILTNKPHDFTELMVSRLLPQWQFEPIIGAMPSLPKKPDPTGALKIAQQLNIKPTGFLYLGDSDIDMKTAAAADMYPLGALWGFRTAGELLAGGARALLQEPAELLSFL